MVELAEMGPPGLMSQALAHMRVALDLLDRAGAPSDVGAQLDLAIVRLEEQMPPGPKSFRPQA